jgi:hypothetical protein
VLVNLLPPLIGLDMAASRSELSSSSSRPPKSLTPLVVVVAGTHTLVVAMLLLDVVLDLPIALTTIVEE